MEHFKGVVQTLELAGSSGLIFLALNDIDLKEVV